MVKIIIRQLCEWNYQKPDKQAQSFSQQFSHIDLIINPGENCEHFSGNDMSETIIGSMNMLIGSNIDNTYPTKTMIPEPPEA